ncbi:hypothetical protein [Kaarinaea lacus]
MNKTFPIVLLNLLLTTSVFAEPGQHPSQFLKPSAGVFNLFLNQLYEQTYCRDWFGPGENPAICSESISYDSDQNLIHIHFKVPPDYTWLENFTQLPMMARKKIFTDLLINTAVNMGVGVRDDMLLSNTLIHSIPIHGEYVSTGFSEEGFKKEIAGRIVVHLATIKENQLYHATRDHHGKIILGGDVFDKIN